jgi:NAD-dependent dihydropyrimidine dehydrogenase PreA subunit
MSYLPWKERRVIPTYEVELYGMVEINRERCNGCGYCALVCPGKAMRISDESGEKKAYLEITDWSLCAMSCNDCAAICKRDAIFVSKPYDFGGFYKTLHRGPFEPPRRF